MTDAAVYLSIAVLEERVAWLSKALDLAMSRVPDTAHEAMARVQEVNDLRARLEDAHAQLRVARDVERIERDVSLR